MIVHLGILFVTFLGSKLYAFVNDGQEEVAGELEPKQLEDKSEAIAESKEEIERKQIRYLKGSVASMGFFAARNFIPGAIPLGLVTYLYSAIPYMRNVEKALTRDKKVNVDVVFFVADVLTFGTGHYFSAALGLTMIHHGKFLVNRAKDNSAKMVTHLYKELPQSVWKLVDGVELEIPLSAVKAGDLLVVTSGSVIPVDGVIQDGVAHIDQQALTGEAQPAEKGKDDPVFANTIVIAGKLVIRVDRSGADTTSAQVAEMLLNSVSFKTGVQLKGERWADAMAVPTLVSAMVVMPFIGPASAAVLINAHIGARILLFAPLTTLRHISEASTLGILVKDGRTLEQLCDVDTILFDKTGTLTTDQPEVRRVTATNRLTIKEVLTIAATAERKLTHPIARAILEKAKEEDVTPYDIQDSKYTMGNGVTVIWQDKVIRVGSVRFFTQEGITIPDAVLKQKEEANAAGNTFILVGIDQQIEGTLELQSQIRPEVRQIVSQLRVFGIKHIGIVSGDDQAPTRKLAEELGMDEYFHNVLPENKAKIVEALQAKGNVVCFVGDGINDSIALKKANVSMSISGATSIAKDNSEIIFMDGTLNRLVEVLELSKRLQINLKRSLILALVPSSVNLVGAFIPKFSILASLLINNAFAAVGVSRFYYTKKRVTPKMETPLPKPICLVDATETIIEFPTETNSANSQH